jgi:2-polyprenyl-3-methyl-5-hydroxy-6-metoxy-1,4-benzoquinol methylase
MDIGYTIQKNVEQSCSHYNDWIISLVSPFVGQRVLDCGCSIGNITGAFLDRELVVGTDISESAIKEIKKKWQDHKNFLGFVEAIETMAVEKYQQYKLDTIMCINVLEHIEDDRQAIQLFHDILEENGRLVLYVPAFQWLYGSMDKADHHFRRYTRKRLRTIFEDSGFTLEKQHYVNFFGIPAWFFNGRVAKEPLINRKKYQLYNSLVPFFRRMEAYVVPPIGLSLFSVYRKTGK